MSQPSTAQQIKLQKLRTMQRDLKKAKAHVRTILRVKALIAVYKGMAPEIVAECYEISLKSLKKWKQQFEADEDLADHARSGRPPKLSPAQAQHLKELITTQKERVWTARHVYVLITLLWQVSYSVRYLPQLLRHLGLSYHKAVHTLFKKDTEQRKHWIQTILPTFYADKIKDGWRIFFQDEVGFQTEGTLTYTWGAKGEKIEVKNYGRHGRVNLIGAFELGSGVFHGIMTSFKVNAGRFRRFLCHLKHEMRTDKLLVICDNASFHKAKWLQTWITSHAAWLRVEFLPAYSPDFNPIERLWRWMKAEFFHNRCWPSKASLKHAVQDMLRTISHTTDDLTGLMRKEIERLEEICNFYETPLRLAA
jgi:transposase